MNSRAPIKNFFKSKSILSIIIIVNVVLWLVSCLLPLVDYLYVHDNGSSQRLWLSWLSLSSQWGDLLVRPWTLVTYMFVHAGFWHLLFNMLMLYWGGVLCCRYLNERRFAWIYFLGGAGGALLYLLVYNAFPVGQTTVSTLVGASAAVLAVFVAVAVYIPNHEVQLWLVRTFPVKLKYIAMAYVAIDLLSIPAANAGGHIAHLGGALAGLLFVVAMRRLPNWKAALRRPARTKTRKSDFQPPRGRSRAMSDDEFNRRKAADQKRIDAILDKISQSGYDHLTKEEKDFLFRKSGS